MTEPAGHPAIVGQIKRFVIFAALAVAVLAAPVAAERYADSKDATAQHVDAVAANTKFAVKPQRIQMAWEIESARSESAKARSTPVQSPAKIRGHIVIAAQ